MHRYFILIRFNCWSRTKEPLVRLQCLKSLSDFLPKKYEY